MEYLLALAIYVGIWALVKIWLFNTYTTKKAYKSLKGITKEKPSIFFRGIGSEYLEKAHRNGTEHIEQRVLSSLFQSEQSINNCMTKEDRIIHCRKEVKKELVVWTNHMLICSFKTVEEIEPFFSKEIIEKVKAIDSEDYLNTLRLGNSFKADEAFIKACALRSYARHKFFDADQYDWFYALLYSQNLALEALLKNHSRKATTEEKNLFTKLIQMQAEEFSNEILACDTMTDFRPYIQKLELTYARHLQYLKAS